ncbi:MAG TPA: amidohydrolase family protein, partial [Candidatus Binatia bacterium]
EIGVDILIWGSDFAHATGDWPHSQQLIEQTFAGVSPEERRKMLADNVIRFFHLDAALDLDKSGKALDGKAVGSVAPGVSS